MDSDSKAIQLAIELILMECLPVCTCWVLGIPQSGVALSLGNMEGKAFTRCQPCAGGGSKRTGTRQGGELQTKSSMCQGPGAEQLRRVCKAGVQYNRVAAGEEAGRKFVSQSEGSGEHLVAFKPESAMLKVTSLDYSD